MSAYRQGEFHAFEGGGQNYLYLVPSAAIFALEDLSSAVLELLKGRELTREQIIGELLARGYASSSIEETLDELHQAHAIALGEGFIEPRLEAPQQPFPLQTIVMNVTNQCNLSCSYCYEYGEDRIATPEGKTKFMSEETARSTVEFLLNQSPGRRMFT